MPVPLILRILVPFAWVALPVTSLTVVYYMAVIIISVLLSFLLQPITTAVGVAAWVGYITYLYINREKPEIKPFEANVSGKEDGEIVLLCHGWPDRAELWAKTLPALEDKYRCITYTLPHHAGRDRTKNFWGVDLDTAVSCIAAMLEAELKKCNKTKALVIGHDWGSMLVMMLERRFPSLVKRLVLVDVLMPPIPTHKRKWIATFVMGMVYQYLNAFTFLLQATPIIGVPIADYMNAAFMRMIKDGVPYKPAPDASSNYLYFYYHLNFLQEKLGLVKSFDERHQVSERKDLLPLCPVLFCYAQDKAFMFHKESTLKKLTERKDGSKVVGFGPKWSERKTVKKEDRVGHWVQWNAAEQFNAEVKAYFAAGE